MNVIPTPPEEIMPDELVGIYIKFCEHFNIKPAENEERFSKRHDLEYPGGIGGLDYRLSIGLKFIGQKGGDSTCFTGYEQSPAGEDEYFALEDKPFNNNE